MLHMEGHLLFSISSRSDNKWDMIAFDNPKRLSWGAPQVLHDEGMPDMLDPLSTGTTDHKESEKHDCPFLFHFFMHRTLRLTIAALAAYRRTVWFEVFLTSYSINHGQVAASVATAHAEMVSSITLRNWRIPGSLSSTKARTELCTKTAIPTRIPAEIRHAKSTASPSCRSIRVQDDMSARRRAPYRSTLQMQPAFLLIFTSNDQNDHFSMAGRGH